MKINGILNREINEVLGKLGHTQKICIADCGLPIPKEVNVVDLSLKIGQPSFIDVLEVINNEMKIEKAYVANEIVENNIEIFKKSCDILNENINVEFICHEDLKKLCNETLLIIRTGEATPYANIILESGVIF